jgi:hypothetical protein
MDILAFKQTLSSSMLSTHLQCKMAYIERFNRTFRQDLLDAHLFEDISQVRILSEKWM